MFKRIKGQTQVIKLLQNAILHERISHAYLFHGSDGVGKFISALYFGMALNCQSEDIEKPCGVCASCHKFLFLEHPDLLYVFPTTNLKLSTEGEIKDNEALAQYKAYIENKLESPWQDFYFDGSTEIRKESISLLIKRLELSMHEGKYRVLIIENADAMNSATANAFLKTLEEPPKNTVIILITERLPKLLPTIISRCQPVYFKPLSQKVIREILMEQFEVEGFAAKSAARICGGNLKAAIRIAREDHHSAREKAFEFLQLTAQGDTLQFLDQSAKTRETIDGTRDLIAHLGGIINDLAVLPFAAQEITNLDKSEYLGQLASEELSEKVPDFLLKLDDYTRKLAGNVNPALLQLNLFISLRKLLLAK